MWEATKVTAELLEDTAISIHAPRVGSDPQIVVLKYPMSQFQSTLPVWGATKMAEAIQQGMTISIHAPRVGSDRRVRRLL